jgi:uncharacterized protein YjbI with pentapeptide repeats
MANEEHVALLKQGVEAWNEWHRSNYYIPNPIQVDLSHADLRGSCLSGASLSKANLRRADLRGADLSKAYLSEADLGGARLNEANLSGAHLNWANLRGANLSRANLAWADLSRTDLIGAHLTHATLVGTDLRHANLTGCFIHGVSAWDLKLEGAKQENLIITKFFFQADVVVDNIEVAQFIYLLLQSEKIRHVIDTITSKAVLILGRFTPERKAVLDALREELRKHDYMPILFDFEKPESKDLTGTVQTLANMARFIIADLTEPSCIPHELAMLVPSTVVPVQPILLSGQTEYAMFVDLKRRYHWVLEPYAYKTSEQLIASLGTVICPAEAKALELR